MTRSLSRLALPALLLALAAGSAHASAAASGTKVTFRYKPGAAKSVHVAGTFNEWKLETELADPDGDGTWELTLDLPPGKHLYKFVVDGSNWTHDPDNSESEPDGHGGKNSLVQVGRVQTGGGAKPAPKASNFGTTKVRKKQLVFTGEVYFVPKNTQRLPDFRTLKPTGKIYTEVFDIAPRNFSEGFPGLDDRFEWFAIRYRGTFRVEKTGKYRIRMISDDAGRLYLNGKVCLDNDGLHGPKEVMRIVKLKKGDHKLVLDYMQGPALEVALQVYITKPNSTVEEPLRATSPPLEDKTKKKH
ncbi:MAG TPA: hypothetical protein DEA08_24270 [Planctomycetes bacterium]|nr:hypothetical protein [Planctomycetota bacterium]